MSSAFMYAIAAMYIAAAVFYGVDGKWEFAALTTCWGIGNAILGMIGQ